ncbi:MAG: hypothetical protein NZ521_09170, partial [Flammeovirgaceae bacterium]|nr:hypothetical protein [Flammeovirgaceae bacterium]
QEHRHADLGGNTVFRGNPHNLWQNPRYGQKHRGGDRKKLKYKDKKKKEEPKADEKTAASTEEETQADKKSKKLVFDPTKDYKAPKNVPQKSKKQPTSKQQPSEEDQIEEENE